MTNAKPFVLEPHFLEKPWGVKPEIVEKTLSVEVPSGIKRVGEIWWVSGHEDYETGITKIVEEHGESFTGGELRHILTEPTITGKTEAWYVKKVQGKIDVIADFKSDITREKYDELVKSSYFDNPDKLKEVFDVIELKEDQTFIIKPGTVHTVIPARGAYALISETQQGFGGGFPMLIKTLLVGGVLSIQVHPSEEHVKTESREDILEHYMKEPTIRISDFGRGRATHPEHAADIIKFGQRTFSETAPVTESLKSYTITHLLANRHFAKDLIKLKADSEMTLDTEKKRFHIIRVKEGSGTISNEKVKKGDTLAIPASLGYYRIRTSSGISFFLEYMPNLQEYARDLLAKGFTREQIKALDGFCYENDFDFLG